MKMLGNGSMGSRRRYLAEQAVFMEELFAKAEGFTTPITKPVASFKAPQMTAPKMAKPKVAGLKPTGNSLPSPTARLQTLKDNMQAKIGQTGPSTGAPAAVGSVGKADRLRRRGKFQRLAPSSVAKAYIPGVGYKPTNALTAAERLLVRGANKAGGKRRYPALPAYQRGGRAFDNAGNQELRGMAQDAAGAQRSSHRNILFQPDVDQRTRAQVLRVAPKKLKGGPVVVGHHPPRGISSLFQPEPEGYVRGGSRRVPAQMHLKRGTGDHTVAHEFTHANRKSLNQDRIRRIVEDRKKLGREEGRADAGAARAGYKRTPTPRGQVDYEDRGAIRQGSARNRFGTYRFVERRIGGPSSGNMDMDEYNRVRGRMGAPTARKVSPGNHRDFRRAHATAVLGHPATPAAVGVAMLPLSIRQAKRQEAERKAKASAAYKARQARRQGVAKALGPQSAFRLKRIVEAGGPNAPRAKQLLTEGRRSSFQRQSISRGTLKEDLRERATLKELRAKQRLSSGLPASPVKESTMRASTKRPGYGPSIRFIKREPLKTHVSESDARKLVGRHGLKGPLPKGLSREQKMAAYEARYVSAGGKKAEKWQRRAEHADKVKTGGLGVATAGGAAWLATRGKAKSRISPKLQHHAETVAGAGAVAGGAGELYASHARRKRSSYASAPAGVAASALRRMQDYTP